jgi:MOSC domain-containing protein YiiM
MPEQAAPIGTVRSVQVGPIAPLGPNAEPSGFVKRPVEGSVPVRELGLAGDAQADLSVHGGPEKAVYGYAAAHYPAWAADFPEHGDKLAWGAFGENLTIEGLAESDLCIGDIHAVGSTRLEVCQPRQPCFKFALRFEDDRLPGAMLRNGRSGWYYRVAEPGMLAAGDTLVLAHRPQGAFPFARLVEIMRRNNASREELAALAGSAAAASTIRAWAARALARR